MAGALRLALSSKISDKDDFRELILRSGKGDGEITFHRDFDSGMVCERDGEAIHVPQEEVLDSVEELIQEGFRHLICQCWSGDIHIDVPVSGKIKIRYSQPLAPPDQKDVKSLIDPQEAAELLEAIEIMNPDGQMSADMRRKYVQIDNFTKLVLPLLRESTRQGKVYILDCGSGKSYLSFVMNYVIREKLRRSCHFYCVDENEAVMQKSIQIRNRLGYDNMDFYVSQIKSFEPEEKVGIVCSLHACDTASDEAIAKAVKLEAPFLLAVPCCQQELANQLKDHPMKALNRHGVFKSRLGDLLTDAMRTLILEASGYRVSVTEYVSPIHTPKNIMILAKKIQSRNGMAMEQYLELKAMFGGVSLELERSLPELFS